jgi:CheY-specific phosphatase CheX
MTATFEELAMLFPEPELSEEQAGAPLDVAVFVNFRGPQAGRLVLRASSVIMAQAAANMLGADSSEGTPLQRDALGELANVVCGNVLPQITHPDVIFHLDAPRHIEAGTMPVRDDDVPVARVQLGIEMGRAEASLYLFSTTTQRPSAVPQPQGTA